MNDTDDLDVDEIEENEDIDQLESKFFNSGLPTKRDIRAEIEKRLEMMELRKLTSDFFYDEAFD
jgi:hypothetical protein